MFNIFMKMSCGEHVLPRQQGSSFTWNAASDAELVWFTENIEQYKFEQDGRYTSKNIWYRQTAFNEQSTQGPKGVASFWMRDVKSETSGLFPTRYTTSDQPLHVPQGNNDT